MSSEPNTPSSTSSYNAFWRRCNYSRKTLTLGLLVLFIAINLIVYSNYLFDFSMRTTSNELEFPLERLETSQMVRSTRHLFAAPPAWTTEWLADQKLDPSLNETEGQDLTIDIVYTWVNGSDTKLQQVKESYQDKSQFFQQYRTNPRNRYRYGYGRYRSGGGEAGDQTANRFRDMDELKYSVRSAAQYANRLFSKIHILTTKIDGEGQVPSWLDLEKTKDVVELIPHDVIFEDKSVLPTFNSLSIESQLHNIPNLTDAFMYLNDDVFLGTQMLPADIWTPLYGFVFHMEPALLVPPSILALPLDTLSIGEWNSLHYSNYLLSKQFGPRFRSYLAHVPHVLSTPLLKEIQSIWPQDLKETSSHRFRGEGEAKDIHISFFMAHYVLERQREIQLSSFWFNRLDANNDGALDWSEREQLIQKIEHWNQASDSRSTKDFSSFLKNNEANLNQLGFPHSGSSIYRLSGLDGFPFMIKGANTSRSIQDTPINKPYLPLESTAIRECKLDIDFCFSPDFRNQTLEKLDVTTTADIFQRMAFAEFHCGDCLLHILRQSATEPGLGSEILPLDKESDVYKTVTADMAKYNYVIATSPYSFVQLQEPYASQQSLAEILSKKDSEAFFCINDNINDNPRIMGPIQSIFKQFLNERFPIPSPWEKP
ncbi:Xanthine phosphoribosyltransferase 1 [Haplosporangium sp. Z 27]|nr:Xanthine phosphoribosyltransferase 1 [Haplosporangium sp. Z 27]